LNIIFVHNFLFITWRLNSNSAICNFCDEGLAGRTRVI